MNSQAYIIENAAGISCISIDHQLLTERKLFLDDVIDKETAISFVQAMLYLAKTPEPIDIYINSPGGEVNSGLLIYDTIQACQNEINMYCIGQAASMAAVLLAAGQPGRRFILPHSNVMIHEVLVSSGIGGSATSISRISESIMETRNLMNGILAQHTGKTLEEINAATSFDNLMTAQQAVEFGICDCIVNSIFAAKEAII